MHVGKGRISSTSRNSNRQVQIMVRFPLRCLQSCRRSRAIVYQWLQLGVVFAMSRMVPSTEPPTTPVSAMSLIERCPLWLALSIAFPISNGIIRHTVCLATYRRRSTMIRGIQMYRGKFRNERC
ncbi:hypothetical protein B0H34DRAFT_687516 [Crassisporium funariophilum]|nr:hypothetical protein B0H34DRAFT_687516 [Crassisporium funariophilum]